MIRKLILVLLLLAMPAAVGWADEYVLEQGKGADELVLVKGKGVEVCEAYKKNLDSFKNKFNRFGYSFLTVRGINPEFKDFSTPKWEAAGDGMDRIKGIKPPYIERGKIIYGDQSKFNEIDKLNDLIHKFLWERDVNPVEFFRGDASKWRGTKKQYADAYKRYYFLRRETHGGWDDLIADVDIDNDGAPEPVYLVKMNTIPAPSLMLVLKPDGSDIDYEKTKLVMMHPSRKEAGWKDVKDVSPETWKKRPELKRRTKLPTGDVFHALHYNVFIYKNKTYFDMMGLCDMGVCAPHDPDNRLRVFFSEEGKTTEICTIKLVSTY